MLLYVKGGAAVTSNEYRSFTVVGNALAGTTGDDTRWGGTVGVGLEYAFAPNWSVGIEYDHLFMQDRTYTFTTPAGVFFSTDRIRSGRRSRHRPHQLQVRRPGHREVLISRLPATNIEAPGHVPGLFCWPRPAG